MVRHGKKEVVDKRSDKISDLPAIVGIQMIGCSTFSSHNRLHLLPPGPFLFIHMP